MKILRSIISCLQHNQHISTSKAFLSLSSPNSSDTQTTHSTVDNQEVSKFQKFEETWWDEVGVLKPLHALNTLRIPFIRDGLKNNGKLHAEFAETSKPLTDINILDVGCGGGILTEPLARLGGKIVGLDASKDLIKCAELHASNDPTVKDNICYIHGSVENICDQHNEKYDAVIASEVVEHVSSQDLFLSSCIQILKPGGSLFLTTLNKTTLSWLFGIVVAEYLLNIVPRGTHDWNKFISPHHLQKLLENYDCRTKLLHGMIYNPVFNKWYWIPDTSVCYVLHAVKKERRE